MAGRAGCLSLVKGLRRCPLRAARQAYGDRQHPTCEPCLDARTTDAQHVVRGCRWQCRLWQHHGLQHVHGQDTCRGQDCQQIVICWPLVRRWRHLRELQLTEEFPRHTRGSLAEANTLKRMPPVPSTDDRLDGIVQDRQQPRHGNGEFAVHRGRVVEPPPQVILESTEHPGVQGLQEPRGFRRHQEHAEPVALQGPQDVDMEMSKGHIHAEDDHGIRPRRTAHCSHHVDHLH